MNFFRSFKFIVSLVFFLILIGLSLSLGIRSLIGLKNGNFNISSEIENSTFLEKEKGWLIDNNSCQNVEDNEIKLYCNEFRKQCKRFILYQGAFDTMHDCVNEVREKLGMSLIKKDSD